MLSFSSYCSNTAEHDSDLGSGKEKQHSPGFGLVLILNDWYFFSPSRTRLTNALKLSCESCICCKPNYCVYFSILYVQRNVCVLCVLRLRFVGNLKEIPKLLFPESSLNVS